MSTLKYILQKEFRQISRDKSILRTIIIMPFIQLIVLPLVADYEVRHINLYVVDQDNSRYSRELTAKLDATQSFNLSGWGTDYRVALDALEKDKADIILEIPPHFERDIVRENKAPLRLSVNAVNGVKGGLSGAYASAIIRDYNNDVRQEWIQMPRFNPVPLIETTSMNWYNPNMNYRLFMVPGIMCILVTMTGLFLATLNIVKEREIGTIEQINVTPIRKYEFLLGKLIPFWLMGLVVLTVGLIAGGVVHGVWPAHGVLAIYGFTAVYLFASLGIGLLISTVSDNQQQAMFVAYFFMMIFILLGGLYTNIDSMPGWAKNITRVNPVAYFIEANRMMFIKGSSLWDIRYHLMSVAGIGVVVNALAIFNYRKRS